MEKHSVNYTLSEELKKAINDHMMIEYHSALLYLAMSHFFAIENYKGLAHWFNLQSKEEYEHFEKFLKTFEDLKINPNFIIPAVLNKWVNIESVLRQSYEHEKQVSTSIHKLSEMAKGEESLYLCGFLKWFIVEQAQEENNAINLLDSYARHQKEQSLEAFDSSLLSRKR